MVAAHSNDFESEQTAVSEASTPIHDSAID
jgi:hypothetical protein